MSEKLLEADFLTVDLSTSYKRADNQEASTSATAAAASSNTEQRVPDDWEKELKDRLAANRALSRESRQTEYDIETQFFKEFFEANWDAECAKQLMLIGELLRKALKTLGFDAKINPILKFLTLDYVKIELVSTKLLNINTFKAVYDAVADNLVADSEFFTANNYDILYCRDLYRKAYSEMKEYLVLQKSVLSPSAKIYTKADQEKNRKVFIVATEKTKAVGKCDSAKNVSVSHIMSVKNSQAKLNPIDIAKKLVGVASKSSEDRPKSTGNEISKLIAKINTPAKVYAVLQYLGISLGNKKAVNGLAHKKLASVSMGDLKTATVAAAELLAGLRLSKSDADNLVDELLSNL